MQDKMKLKMLSDLIHQLITTIADCAKNHSFEKSKDAAETLQRTTDAYTTLKELMLHEEYVRNMTKDESGVDTEFMLPGEGPLKSSN